MGRLVHYLLTTLILTASFGCAPKEVSPKKHTSIDEIDLSEWDDEESNKPVRVFNPNNGATIYAITVATFTGPYHAESARGAASKFVLARPDIGRELVVRPRRRGSVLTFGSYTGYDDPKAKEDIKALRSIRLQDGRPAFGQMILTRFRSPRSIINLHPYDLWTVRRDYPSIVPIYTLDVAIWGDFESGQLPQKQRRSAAEGYAASLRSKGFESYFYHDDEQSLSSVTVGLFDYKAVDAETGFYNWEVDALIEQFPERLVNGEQFMEFRNPSNPSLGTRPQQPRLVEVPID
ncbi:hypothetical protein H8D29_03965 [PVC group bacterium]|nr:hypothetical protein [PVC group bacterium]